jgi:hypothetical protein
MAKVKIQGHASGTGILTVTAPNTSTDRTITLPDATGTLLNSDGDGSSLTGVGVDGISSSAASSSEHLVIDSSGNVSIGAPNVVVLNGVAGNSKLVIKGSDTATATTSNSDASLTIANDDGTAGNLAGLHFARADTDDNPHYAGASIVAKFLETQVTGHYPKSKLTFLTSTAANHAPSEKMRLESSGQLRIDSAITAAATNPLYIVSDKADSSSSNRMIGFENSSQGRGYILAGSGDSSSPSFAAGSDRRLKENITNYTGGYEKIKSIPVKQWDEKYSSKNKGVTGWIADELDDVFPNAVSGTPNATKDVINSVLDKDGRLVLENTTEEEFDENQTKGKYPNCTFHETATVPEYQHSSPLRFYADVVQALQSAITKIEILEAKVTALENA